MKLKELLRDEAYRQGIVLFAGGMLANVLNYFYRVLMGRMLEPEVYGELAVLISFFLILIVPTAPLQLAAARYAAVFEANDFSAKLRRLFIYLTKASALAGLVLVALIVFSATQINGFLKLSSINDVYLLAAIVAVTFISGIAKGILQGLRRFSKLSYILILEAIARVVISWVLVAFGFKMFGALAGFLIPPILFYLLTIYFMKDVIEASSSSKPAELEGGGEKKEIWRYFVLGTIVFLFLNIMLSMDKILVKHYFSPFDAGIFAAFSTLGQAIFIAVTSLGGIIFSMAASKQAKKEDYLQPLKIISAVCALVLIAGAAIFWIFSKESIDLFFGSKYLEGAPYLGYYSVAMGLFGFIFFLSYFFMALNKFEFLWTLVAGGLMEVILISLWHNGFFQVISMFLVSLIFCLIGMVFLILRDKKERYSA